MVADGAVEFTLTGALAAGVAALSGEGRLTIAEFTPDGIVVWRVCRDAVGTPQCHHWPATPWSVLAPDGTLSSDAMRQLLPRPVGTLVVVLPRTPRGRDDTGPALGWLRAAFQGAQVHVSDTSLANALRHVIREQPITQSYELVVLRQRPSGRLSMDTLPLMPPGATRGYREAFRIRCAASDEHGTAFAVVAREAEEWHYRPVSVRSAQLPPGLYEVSAVLRRPGKVEFEGLPVPLREDARPWHQIVDVVPDRIAADGLGTHAVCLVEMCGADHEVLQRILLVRELIESMYGQAERRLRVSLISYGAHSFERGDPAGDPMILAWADDAASALVRLEDLRERGAVDSGYTRAAQLECALAAVTAHLTSDAGQPMVVSVGSRPPFPPRADLASRILPCPHRNDWRRELHRLAEHPGITFGALYGPGTPDPAPSEAWERLGADALQSAGDTDLARFASELGALKGAENHLPFPLYEPEWG